MNILIFGFTPEMFTTRIAERLVSKGHQVLLLSLSFSNPYDINIGGYSIANVPLKSGLVKGYSILKGCFLLNRKVFRKKIFLEYSLINIVRILLYHEYYVLFQKYDTVNIQMVTVPVFWSFFIEERSKIVTSFWGSDLLKEKENQDTLIKHWINRSEKVTLHSDEMEKILLNKFQKVDAPIVQLLFPLESQVFDDIDLAIKTPSDKITIGIGYNAGELYMHLDCLDEINKLSPYLKSKIHLLFLFHYRKDPRYTAQVIAKADTIKVSYSIISDKMENQELVQVRKDTDILLMVPTHDAFSATVSEILYAGNIVICGDWLPYSRYKKNEVYLEYISSITEISERLNYVVSNYEVLKEKAAANKSKVMKTLEIDENCEKWCELLL